MKRELGELKSLGVFGICKGAYNIIFSSKKIFYQIILALLLPLTLITLTEIQLTRVLFGEFLHQKRAFELPNWPSFKDDDVLNWVTSLPTQESTLFWLFKFAFFLVDVFLHVLFSSAVVYTAACIYIAKPISVRKVMSAAPKAIMRLIITDLCSLVVFLGFSFAAVALFLGFYYLSNYNRAIILSFAAVGRITLPFVYLIGLVYILISWNLACAVSVLEDVDGVKALIKSFSLVKGKVLYATLIFVMMQLLNMAIECGWEALVAYGQFEGVLERVMRWTLYNPLLEVANLVRLVIQTVIYFVCKSYHQESVDKSRLADHLEVDMVDYLLLQNKEQFLISV